MSTGATSRNQVKRSFGPMPESTSARAVMASRTAGSRRDRVEEGCMNGMLRRSTAHGQESGDRVDVSVLEQPLAEAAPGDRQHGAADALCGRDGLGEDGFEDGEERSADGVDHAVQLRP